MNSLPRRELTLLDSTCLIVGIIVGAGIYQVAPDVAKSTASNSGFLALWLAGGLLSWCGAMSYAELATAYPQSGGDYVYLSRAYGPWAGFLFGWIQTVIVRPGDIAVMAFAFATYARAIHDPLAGASLVSSQQLYAALAVLVLTLVNVAGVRQGKWTQNVLTLAKIAGLAVIVGVACLAPRPVTAVQTVEALPVSLALILVLFTFGGWNEMAYVAAEVLNPNRNIVRALALGTGAVTALYLLVNVAFLHALGHNGVAASSAVAADAVRSWFGQGAPVFISLLICLSALGAVNGLIFAGARISYAVGRDHRIFRLVSQWNAKQGTPVRALVLQGLIALALIFALGGFVDTLLYTAAPVYLFYLGTSLALMVLRFKEPAAARPYRVWGYPVTPLVFAGTCSFLAYSAVLYKPRIALAALGLLLTGLPAYWISQRRVRKAARLAKVG
ncbi:MAG: amino acid permease [Verrucomicrobia bacterium]|nr:amino acid permease [Verrucomicrobiota bacterium]